MSFLLALLLQDPAAPPPSVAPSVAPPVSLERVKRALDRPSVKLEHPPPEVPIFRLHVQERSASLEPLWKDQTVTPLYVRPKMPITHYEFLASVTPEELRAATLYPCCINLVPMFEFLYDQATAAGRSYRELRAKRTVEKALREIRVTRKN